MKATSQSKGRRKKKVKSPSKAVYREHQVIRRLLRYIDRHRVVGLLDTKGIEGFPRVFFASAEGHRAVKVTVDWLGVIAGLENAIDILATGRSAHLTAERLAEVKRFRSTQAAFYVLEFLPEAIDSALSNLYVEAFTKISVEQGRPGARTGVEILASMDYEHRVQRLGIREGPKARFEHRSQYENVLKNAMQDLLSEGEEITQEAVAGKLTEESQDALDQRMIRRWNKEFGVNWKMFVKQIIKADKS